MKYLFLLINMFLIGSQLHSQDWSDWANCSGDPCISNLQYKYKYYPMENGKYELKINIKNNFSEKIYFKFIVSNITNQNGSFEGRTEAGPHQETGSWGSWTITKSITTPRVTIEDVRFGKSDIGGYWRCNHLNGFFESPLPKTSTNSESIEYGNNSNTPSVGTGSVTLIQARQDESYNFNEFYKKKQQDFEKQQKELETVNKQNAEIEYQRIIQENNRQADVAQQKLVESTTNLTNMIVQGIADNRRRKEEHDEMQRIREANEKREAEMERRALEQEQQEIRRVEQLKRELPNYLDADATKNLNFYNIQSARYFYFVAKIGENVATCSNIFMVLPDKNNRLPFVVDLKNKYQLSLNYSKFWLFGPLENQSKAIQHKMEIISIITEHYWSFNSEHTFHWSQSAHSNDNSFWGEPAKKSEKEQSNEDFWGDSNANSFKTVGKFQNENPKNKTQENTSFWGEQAKEESPISNQKKESGKWLIHIVQEGETLFSIHQKYNISIETIRQNNRLVDNNLLIGQSLKILPQ